MDEQMALGRLREVLVAFDGTPVMRRLAMRIRELGDNQLDEVKQLRQLQKACREDASLAAALRDAGFGDVAGLDTVRVAPSTGVLVQALNHLIEDRSPPFNR
ncbi:MAG: hypothetical protein AMXMBFR64_41240 [Myxococcales bacterium]